MDEQNNQPQTPRKLLTSLTLAALLLSLLKVNALLVFWQQSHHWFLNTQANDLPQLISSESSWLTTWEQHWQSLRTQTEKRMTLASRILVEGDSALPAQKNCDIKKIPAEKSQCTLISTKSINKTKTEPNLISTTHAAESSKALSSKAEETLDNNSNAQFSSAASNHSESQNKIDLSNNSDALNKNEALNKSESLNKSEASNNDESLNKKESINKNEASSNNETSSKNNSVDINSAANINSVPNTSNAQSKVITPEAAQKNTASTEKINTDDLTVIDQAMKNHEPIPVDKGEKFLLIGDSMMQGVAPHLTSVLQRKYAISAVDMGTQSTGLTYPSFFDWPAHVEQAFLQEHYFALVVLLGANDTWDMIEANHYVKFASVSWREKYANYTRHILETAQKNNTKVIWLSAPPMGREDIADRISVVNEIIENEIKKFPLTARFVATANVLTSDGKTYTKFIDVPDRGNVMVRVDDGIHFTSYGENLLARLVLNQFKLKPIESHSSRNP